MNLVATILRLQVLSFDEDTIQVVSGCTLKLSSLSRCARTFLPIYLLPSTFPLYDSDFGLLHFPFVHLVHKTMLFIT